MARPQFHYSPSLYHQQLMDGVTPSLAYDGGDVTAWQKKLRRKVKQLLGYTAPKRTPLNVRSLWQREHKLGTIEKIVFTSEPYADVPCYVCRPKDVEPPYTFFICLQGHSTGMHNSIAVDINDETKSIKVEGDRDFALGCMQRGLAALCIEQRSFGERAEKIIKTNSMCNEAASHALMLGKTLAAERVFDVARGIQYLRERGDCDMRRIGIMGNSGGGTISMFSCALAPEIAFAMPSCHFCTFRDSIMSIPHCMDNHIPGLYLVADMADIVGLFAPKPVVIVAGREDNIFPIKGVRKAFKALKRIYAAAGAEEHCHFVVGDGGHRFYAELGWRRMIKEVTRET